MKDKFLHTLTILFICLIVTSSTIAKEIFNFNVTEVEITQNGNVFKGNKGGEAFTNDGITIEADYFEYNKISTILISSGNVRLKDKKKNIIITSEKITYLKNKEIIIAEGDARLEDEIKNIVITSDKISFFKNEEKIEALDKVELKDFKLNTIIKGNKITFFKNPEKVQAEGNVELLENNKNIKIKTNKITYIKNLEKIYTEGTTIAEIYSKYKLFSNDLLFLRKEMRLSSNNKTIIEDNNFSKYETEEFIFNINEEFLKGKNISIIQNTNVPIGKSDQFFFQNGFFDLKNKNFKAAKTEVKLKKNIFERIENDPRIYGISSSREDNITSFKKAVFTSCKKTDKCPPWRLESSEIKHDKNKKQLIYNNTILKVYDVPVLYFPKFFHPDPTVKRQSGFLQPKIRTSNILGNSLSIPYFYAISENKDLTINPVIFSKNAKMFQNEFRQKNKDSSIIADFGITNGFKSSTTQKKKNINHLFAKIEKKLNLNNFIKSDLKIFVERVSKDTYLKIFDNNLPEDSIKPKNLDNLNSGFNFFLEHENFSFTTGADIFEDLTQKQSDRYQFVLPYYNFSKNVGSTNFGTFLFNSKGNNVLSETNKVKSKIINDLNFSSNDKILDNIGLKNNLNIYFKNLNGVGKNIEQYKSSPEVNMQTLIELNSELPLFKTSSEYEETLIPRISLRSNPGDMKDYSSAERKININNIFDINRIAIDDSFEAGNSITFGGTYKRKNIKFDENFLELKLASVFRDRHENNIPSQTTLNNKNSNIFGSMNYAHSKQLNLEYNFAIDEKIENFNYNSVGIGLSLNNFVTKFNFIKENSILGNANVYENESKYNFNEFNSLYFKTRRNREIDLTEYYDLVYEYNNDCLKAGIKFNKTYYEDRDLKPSENLMFTISFYPLTSFEQSLVDLVN